MAQHSVTAPSLSVLIVGAGFIASQHAAAIRACPGLKLIGVVDVDPVRAETAARQEGGVRWSTNLAEALGWPEVDGVIVCTPNHTHRAVGLQIAAAGKHLLIEKPLATTVGDAVDLARAFATADRVLMAAHTHRFYDYARIVKEEIAAGSIGRPVFARLALLGGWIWPDWRAWMIDAGKSGGHSLHNGVHLLDLMTWWFDDHPVSVYARGHKQTSARLDIYDYLELTVEFAGGGSAVCEMSRGHQPGNLDRRDLLVLGTEGILAQPPEQWGEPLINQSGTTALAPQASNGFVVQLQAWQHAVGGGRPAMTADEAVQAVALGVAAEQSIELGAPVRPEQIGQGAGR